MSGADYILGLLAIVTGLAISDMIASLHGLLINRRQIKWDWLSPLSAAAVLLLIIDSWRIAFVGFQGAIKGPPIWIFLLVLASIVPLYLAARAALPDRVESRGPLDLGVYYGSVSRYLWSAVAVTLACFVMTQLLAMILFGRPHFPRQAIQATAMLALALTLAVWPQRHIHRFLVPLFLIMLGVLVLPLRLLVA